MRCLTKGLMGHKCRYKDTKITAFFVSFGVHKQGGRMKTLIVMNLINRKVLAEATVNEDEHLNINAKNPEIKDEVEFLLHDLFTHCLTYRTGGPSSVNGKSQQTVSRKASGEEKLYAIWDAIAGSRYEIGGRKIRAYVREEAMRRG